MMPRAIHTLLSILVIVFGAYVGMMMDQMATVILLMISLAAMMLGMAVERTIIAQIERT